VTLKQLMTAQLGGGDAGGSQFQVDGRDVTLGERVRARARGSRAPPRGLKRGRGGARRLWRARRVPACSRLNHHLRL